MRFSGIAGCLLSFSSVSSERLNTVFITKAYTSYELLHAILPSMDVETRLYDDGFDEHITFRSKSHGLESGTNRKTFQNSNGKSKACEENHGCH
jgi:hypothetical protein